MSSSATVYAGTPPAGQESNPNAPFEATGLIVVIAIFVPLATILTCLRTYTRAVLAHGYGLDDAVMCFATVLSIIMSGFCLAMLNYGLGKHLWDVPITDLYPRWMLYNVIAAIIFCAASSLSKISILLLYIRIFTSKRFQIVVWGLAAFTFCYGAAGVFVNIFSCNPIKGSWELAYATTAKCIDRPAWYFAQAGLGIFVDFSTLLIPLPALWKLQMPKKTKMGVAFLLTIGAFVCIVSIVRLQSLYELLNGTDLTRVTANALMWCVLELNLSIIGGDIPANKLFFKKYLPALIGRSTMGYHYNTGSQPYGRSGRSTKLRSGNSTDISKSSHPMNTFDPRNESNGFGRTTDIRNENSSEEYILQGKDSSFGPKENNVRVTTRFGYTEEVVPGQGV